MKSITSFLAAASSRCLCFFQSAPLRWCGMLLTLTLLLTGCAGHRPVYWHITKQSNLEKRHNYMHVLKENGVRIIQVGENVRLVFPSQEMFRGQSTQFSAQARELLDLTGKLINTYDVVTVKVAAYSAGRQTTLTTHQAQAVSRKLYYRGVNARVVYAVGYGNHYRIASNQSEIGRSHNWRVEVSFRYYPHFASYN